MPASPYDSRLYGALLTDRGVGALFTDGAEIRAMLLTLGALAKAQAEVGLIPETAAAAIDRAAREAEIDPAALAQGVAANAVPVPGLIAAFRAEIGAPEHAQYVHWGTTSQDLMDTGLALRLRQALGLIEGHLIAAIRALGTLADTEADTPMALRTWGQVAVPGTFGGVVTGWGEPLIDQLEALGAVRARLLHVSIAGAAGTLGVMGEHGPAIRADVARRLGLSDPGRTRHADRSGIAALSSWATLTAAHLGRMGEDLVAMTATGEVALDAVGGSSTMPHKRNPVGPALLSALARTQVALDAGLQGAALHRQQRDAAAWMTEWLLLPQAVLGLARACAVGIQTTTAIRTDRTRLSEMGGDRLRLMDAEALSFALAATMPRPDAQTEAKRLVARAQAEDRPLADVARIAHPDLPFDGTPLGEASAEARAFAARAAVLRATD